MKKIFSKGKGLVDSIAAKLNAEFEQGVASFGAVLL